MWKPAGRDIPFHYLKPGEMLFGDTPTLVSTLLGSCVSITMFNWRLRIGAICHGLLPICREKNSCNCNEGYRYVECSIRLMLQEFGQRGVLKKELEVKVFGGSDMFSLKETSTPQATVGKQNIMMAIQVLEEEGIKISASDLGGGRGRKIFFYTNTGEVLLKRLLKSELDEVQRMGNRELLPRMAK